MTEPNTPNHAPNQTIPPSSAPTPEPRTFWEFYPYYLSQHADRTCRRLHFVGTAIVLGLFAISMMSGRWWMLALLPVAGYGFAWVGHFFFEKNRPATFTYPLWSLAGDFVMFKDIALGRIPW